MLTSLWPMKTNEHATPQQISELPLHSKTVKRSGFAFFRNLLNATKRAIFDEYCLPFTHPESWAGTSGSPPDDPVFSELSENDHEELVRKGFIRRIPRNEVRGWCSSFSVAEKENSLGNKTRRRWILHPRFLNSISDPRPFSISTRNYHKVRYRYGVTVDIKWYFGCFALSKEQGAFFSFLAHDGSCYAATSMPTGARECPGLVQVVTEDILEKLLERFRDKIGIETADG